MKLEEQYKILYFRDLGDERGNLVVIEGEGMDVPFDIKRVFYLYGSDDKVVRGQHANRETEFILVNVGGSSRVRVDNGTESKVIELNRPGMGLYLPPMLWKDMYDFSPDSILMVLASRHYDDREYIRDYSEYLEELKKQKSVSEPVVKGREGKISVIIPVYYNEDTLMDLYQDMKDKILGSLGDYELVFVDDGSGDRSWEIMNEISRMDGRVHLVKLSRNFGEHAALLAGLSVCSGDCAVTKQADLQEDSTLITSMYESWKRGNKVVLAVRRSRDESRVKVFFANLYYAMVRKCINKGMPWGGCDCYLLDRKVIEVLERLDEKNSSLTLQVLWAGFQTDRVYFDRRDREKGKSRWTFAKKFKLVLDSLMSFSYVPIRLMSGIGLLFDIFSVVMLVSVMIEYFTKRVPIDGWASLMCVLLLSAGLILSMLGILGEYLWRTLDASRKRPPFIIDEEKMPDEQDETGK